jgi:hypothetical protein
MCRGIKSELTLVVNLVDVCGIVEGGRFWHVMRRDEALDEGWWYVAEANTKAEAKRIIERRVKADPCVST